MIMNQCEACISDGSRCVPGRGPLDATIMFVGEAPGRDEDKAGKCWIGKAGKELANYCTTIARIDIDSCYLNNLVKCHPPNDRDPRPSEIAACGKILDQEIININPKYIATLGRYSTRYFLGDDANLERVHGVPIERNGRIIIPIYHPAAGMHNTTLMTQIADDFTALGRLVRGQIKLGAIIDEYPDPIYRVATPRSLAGYLAESDVVAIDTESVKDDVRPWRGGMRPWCISISTHPGTALVTNCEFETINRKLSSPSTITIVHNVMYDLPILHQMGIRPSRMYCTMIMAYLTQSLPQGLKDLAYRLCGMKMTSYDEMVEEASNRNAYEYLGLVGSEMWPDTEPELVWEKAGPKVKKGWPLHKRVAKIWSDYQRSPNGVNLRDRWEKIEKRMRLVAEDKFGLMPTGDLSEIPIDEAINYSARDADGVLRVYPVLLEKLAAMNIEYPNVDA